MPIQNSHIDVAKASLVSVLDVDRCKIVSYGGKRPVLHLREFARSRHKVLLKTRQPWIFGAFETGSKLGSLSPRDSATLGKF